MAAPPGGPEDKAPPTVVAAQPEQNAVNIPLDRDVTLEFSEPVNRPSVEAALYLSPEPRRRLRYRWSGRRLTLDYLDALPANRTIVVTVGAQAKDLQGNALESSYTLAFSTGDHIDRGSIEGLAALPEGARTISITAYMIKDSFPDPMSDVPDYRISTTPDGKFELGYLASGRYRLFALDDRNFDGLWSPATESIGTANQDVRVEDNLESRVSFAPTLQDTTPSAILRARQLDEWTLDVRFNRDSPPDRIDVADANGRQSAIHHREDTTATGAWRVFLDRKVFGDSATVFVEIDGSPLTSHFAVQTRSDTSRPGVSASLPLNGSVNRFVPREAVVLFNEPIVYKPTNDSLRVTLREDTTDLEVQADQTDPVSVTFNTPLAFREGAKYKLAIPVSFVTDRSGNSWSDSLWTLSWYTYPEDSLGSIEGFVSAPELGPWLVELYKLKSSEAEQSVFTNSSFKFEAYPAGDYRIRVIRDANGDQLFNTGSISPFEFSEPFEWHPDTISVRPRWTADVEFLWTTVTQK